MRITVDNDIKRHGKGWQLRVKFSDHEYTMIKEDDDICELQKIQAILDKRTLQFFRGDIDTLKTSDLGLTYIKEV
jgi:Fe-S cluster assembly iron-binding protein IscA